MPPIAINSEINYLKESARAGGVMGILGAFAAGRRGNAAAAGRVDSMNERVPESTLSRPEEFEALAMPLARALYGTAFRMLGNSQRAEDIVQDAYARAWEKFDQFQKGSNFKAWIFQILVFLCRNEVRTNRNRPVQGESVEQILQGMVSAPQSDSQAVPSTTRVDWCSLYADSVDDQFKRSLDNLDPDNRAVLILVSLAEFTYQECAEALDMPLGTVMSRLYRARKQLQDELRSYAVERGFLRASAEEAPHE